MSKYKKITFGLVILQIVLFLIVIVFFEVDKELVIRIDGEEIYSFGKNNKRPFGHTPGSVYNFVDIPEDCEEGILLLVLNLFRQSDGILLRGVPVPDVSADPADSLLHAVGFLRKPEILPDRAGAVLLQRDPAGSPAGAECGRLHGYGVSVPYSDLRYHHGGAAELHRGGQTGRKRCGMAGDGGPTVHGRRQCHRPVPDVCNHGRRPGKIQPVRYDDLRTD